jgi:methylated-DNA-[protein]-cysteine S-methyltransferase
MIYKTTVQSPLGEILLATTEAGLCGLFFPGQKHFPANAESWAEVDPADSRFRPAKLWLDAYFSKSALPPQPSLDFAWGTEFQRRVWEALIVIPPAETTTYSAIAQSIGSPTAVRAVGAAVGKNPISIIVPCHRVIGSSGGLTGYAGGLEKKRWMLAHEETDFTLKTVTSNRMSTIVV